MADDTDRIDEIVSDLDDLKTSVEEVADTSDADPKAIKDLQSALEDASDAADELEDDQEGR